MQENEKKNDNVVERKEKLKETNKLYKSITMT
jgi:hypothetical protein